MDIIPIIDFCKDRKISYPTNLNAGVVCGADGLYLIISYSDTECAWERRIECENREFSTEAFMDEKGHLVQECDLYNI